MAAAPKAAKHTPVKTVLTRGEVGALKAAIIYVPDAKAESFETNAKALVKYLKMHRQSAWLTGKHLAGLKKDLSSNRACFLDFLWEFAQLSEMSASNYMALYAAWPKSSDYREAVVDLEADGVHAMRRIYAKARPVINERNDKKPQTRTSRSSPLKAVLRFVKEFDPKTLRKIEPDQADDLRTELVSAQAMIVEALLALPAVPTKKPAAKARQSRKAA